MMEGEEKGVRQKDTRDKVKHIKTRQTTYYGESEYMQKNLIKHTMVVADRHPSN